ncbi:MAG: TonB family protein [Calditrichia bacterium]
MRPHVIISMVICLFSFLAAQGKVSGKLTQDTVWKNLVWVNGDVIVPKNVTLTIEPGCRVRMEPKTDKTRSGKAPERIEIIIFGTLIAKGVEGNGRIVFTSRTTNQKMNDWYGIVFKNRNNRSVMQNCLVEYAYKGITCYGSAPMIANSEIRFNQYAGISAEIRSKPIIRNTMISGNEFGGIICELASNPIVEKSIITQNTNGIIVFDQSKPDLGSVRGTDGQSIGENLIFNNFETNIYNHSANDIYAQNNSWNTANSTDIESSLFDGGDNAAKGKVVFLPVGGNAVVRRTAPVAAEPEPGPLVVALPEDPKRRSRDEAIESVDRKSASATRRKEETNLAKTVQPQVRNAANNKPLAASTPPPKTKPATTTSNTAGNQVNNKPASTGNTATQPAATPPASVGQPTVAKQETLIVYRDRIVPEKKAPTVTIPQEPLIEALLDGGRRQYAKRVKPRYPAIYQKTGNEGKVFMEVIVGKTGKVENYRIIRSDGDLFSESATEAIKGFEYKPATYKGQPVSFKLVEPFFFKLGK